MNRNSNLPGKAPMSIDTEALPLIETPLRVVYIGQETSFSDFPSPTSHVFVNVYC